MTKQVRRNAVITFAAALAATVSTAAAAFAAGVTTPTTPVQHVQAGTVFVLRAQPGEARYGVDVSWPQCGSTLPQVPLDFAVVGITAGHASSVSRCAADQAGWTRSVGARLGVYVVPNSPDAATLRRADALAPTTRSCRDETPGCRAYRAGIVQARDALRASDRLHLSPRSWWLDVEETPGRTLWSGDTAANVAVLRGWVDTLRAGGHRVGVYSTGGYWDMITGGWQVDLPQWVAVGEAGLGAARQGCGSSFTAGPVLLTQWLTGPVDGDLVCPGHRTLALSFFQGWHRARTAGVPPVLTIPVPHPHPAVPVTHTKHEKKHSKPDKKKAAAAPTATPHAAPPALPKAPPAKPSPRPSPHATATTKPPAPPRPTPSRTSRPTPAPTPSSTATPAPSRATTTAPPAPAPAPAPQLP